MNEATWSDGTNTIAGRWFYAWHAKCFVIQLDAKDPVCGLPVEKLKVYGDHPEWGKWKLNPQAKPDAGT
jgi:hypothetical protein